MVINRGDKHCRLVALHLYITRVCHYGLKGQLCPVLFGLTEKFLLESGRTLWLKVSDCCKTLTGVRLCSWIWGQQGLSICREAVLGFTRSVAAAQLRSGSEASLGYEGGAGWGSRVLRSRCATPTSPGALFPFPPSV